MRLATGKLTIWNDENLSASPMYSLLQVSEVEVMSIMISYRPISGLQQKCYLTSDSGLIRVPYQFPAHLD